jgi:hypothetical protein
MESHGERNKIHISQATAELIERDGKGYVVRRTDSISYVNKCLTHFGHDVRHWLTQRNEKIEAKGKGKMITFWCEPLNANPSVSVSTASGAEATAVSSCVSTASEDQVDRVDL